jgi:hypothetical protein
MARNESLIFTFFSKHRRSFLSARTPRNKQKRRLLLNTRHFQVKLKGNLFFNENQLILFIFFAVHLICVMNRQSFSISA